jgi:hypothetical protein
VLYHTFYLGLIILIKGMSEEASMMAMAENEGGGSTGQTSQLSDPGKTKYIAGAVVAVLVIGFLIWWFLQGEKICSKNSQSNHSSPSFDSVTGSSSKK